MKRKVVKHGTATLTVSLPSKWVKRNSLKQGDEIEIEEKEGELSIVAHTKVRSILQSFISSKNINYFLLKRRLVACYCSGFDSIVINIERGSLKSHKDESIIDIYTAVKKVLERFIGLEIVQQSKEKLILQVFIPDQTPSTLETLQGRIFFLFQEFSESILSGNPRDKSYVSQAVAQHDTINRFVYYLLRSINLSDLPTVKKTRLFALYTVIDRVADKYRHIAEAVAAAPTISSEARELTKKLMDCFLHQFESFLFPSKNRTLDLVEERYKLVRTVHSAKLNTREMRILVEAGLLLEVIDDFTEATMTLSESFTGMSSENFIETSDKLS